MITRHQSNKVATFPIAARSKHSGDVRRRKPLITNSNGVVMQKTLGLVAWAMAAFIFYIYVWYLQYKFFGHPGSVELFTTLTDWLGFSGHEKFMRISTGSMELVASLLLVIPATQIVGAAFSFGIISGAIFFHLASPLGVDPYGDGGVLFKQACAVWMASAGILVIHRHRVFELVERYLSFLPIPVKLRMS
jgi:hypothetical protein